MNKNILTWTLLLVAMTATAQIVPPDPVPDCEGIQRVGVIQANGQNTQYFVGGFGVASDPDDCDGVSINVIGDNLLPGEFAYGAFDADVIRNTTPEEVDFSFDLSETLENLPPGGEVTIAELYSPFKRIAELRLRKFINPQAMVAGSKGQKMDPQLWKLTVRWYGAFSSIYSEDFFVFGLNEVVEYNYVFDDSDPGTPVALISFGGNRVSVSPYTDGGGGFTYPTPASSSHLTTYFLGLIETNTTLIQGDKIKFEINWNLDTAATE